MIITKKSLIFALVALSAFTFGPRSQAAPANRRKDFPCKGCLFDPPGGDAKKAPLLVVLHGDKDTASAAAAPWENATASRHVALFVPQCPASEGCDKGSWWMWDGDPKWLDGRVRAIEAEYAIDADQIWLSGWSGGASYMGWRATSLGGRYAAIAITGGGMPPPDKSGCPRCSLPVYFMVGDANPLHHLAKSLREYFDACGGEVVWDLQKGATHGGELMALGKPAKVAAILDWFAAHPRKCPAAIAPVVESADKDAGPMDAASAPAAPSTSISGVPAPATSADPPAPPVRGRCGCEAPGSARGSGISALVLLGLAISRRAAAGWRRGRASRTA